MRATSCGVQPAVAGPFRQAVTAGAEGFAHDVRNSCRSGEDTLSSLCGQLPCSPAAAVARRPPVQALPRRSSSTDRAPSSGSAWPPGMPTTRSTPRVKSSSIITGPAAAFGRYLQGEVDIVDASRPAKPDEEAKAKAQGIDWTRFLVGYDGITLVVNPKNDFVKSLSVAQLKAIWEPYSKVKTWKDVDPSWPEPQDHPVLAGQRFGDVRVLHRGDRRQGQEPARGRPDQLGRQYSGHRRVGRHRRAGLLRLCLLRRHTGKLRAVRRPERRRWPSGRSPAPRRSLTNRSSAVAAPLYLREEFGRCAGPRSGVPQALPEKSTGSPCRRLRRPTAEDKAANQRTLAKLCLTATDAGRRTAVERSRDSGTCPSPSQSPTRSIGRTAGRI